MSHPYQSASPTDRSRHDCYRTTPPPIQTHRSEGTQAYYSSDRPSQDHLHHAHSTSDLPLQPRSSITRSGHVGTRTNRASSASAGSGGGESSSTSRKIKAAQDELKRAQYELDKAIRESQLEAEMESVRRHSEADEEGRMMRHALAESAQHDRRRISQERVEDERMGKAMIDSGDGRLTSAERREREDLEMVMALSLSERRDSNRLGVGTSADAFERMSRPSPPLESVPELQASPHLIQSHRLSMSATRASFQAPRRSSFCITNPDLDEETTESPPPSYTVESPQSIQFQPCSPTASTSSLRPGPSPLVDRIITTPVSSPLSHRLSTLSSTARAGSFSSTISSEASITELQAEAEAETPKSVTGAGSFYPAFLSAAMGLAPMHSPLDIDTPVASQRSYVSELDAASVEGESNENPFEDTNVARDSGSVYSSEGYGEAGEALEEVSIDSTALSPPDPLRTPPRIIVPEVTFEASPSLSAVSNRTTFSSTSSINTADFDQLNHLLPSEGGLVETSNLNATPNEEVIRKVRFGFLPVTLAARYLHPPLKQQGSFPDIVVLSSQMVAGKAPYQCFAVEAKGWKSLLQYLMWFGNSRIQAAQKDLEGIKFGQRLHCAITLEFFRSFEDGETTIRCRLDLVKYTESAVEETSTDEVVHSTLDPDCPKVTIRLARLSPLPCSLSTLANAMFVAHTASREPRRSLSSHTSPSSSVSIPSPRSLKILGAAIDLFQSLAGEPVLSREEAESDESKLLSKWKSKLKRRSKKPGIVKGGADGMHRDIPDAGVLPVGAMMVTPFRLDES